MQKEITKLNSRSNSAYIITFILTILWTILILIPINYYVAPVAHKPIIYIYPQEQTEIK